MTFADNIIGFSLKQLLKFTYLILSQLLQTFISTFSHHMNKYAQHSLKHFQQK